MIKKKLDIIQVDVSEDEDGVITYQGATFFYSREVWEDGVLVGKLDAEAVSATVEQAEEILGSAAGAHVKKLDEVENILAAGREEWTEEKTALEGRIAELTQERDQAASVAQVAIDRLEAIRKLSA